MDQINFAELLAFSGRFPVKYSISRIIFWFIDGSHKIIESEPDEYYRFLKTITNLGEFSCFGSREDVPDQFFYKKAAKVFVSDKNVYLNGKKLYAPVGFLTSKLKANLPLQQPSSQ